VVPLFKKLLADGLTELPVTDPRMTRFWITLSQGIEFVISSFSRMYGGEIFVPKIPSMRILDLIESLAPGMAAKNIGIRPGEKLHEIMCPADDSHLTVEMADHYVIRPSIRFVNQVDYLVNACGESGIPVPQGFEYNSGTNPHVLTIEELRQMNQQ
jgi:UDP-N-acetylglucosamine 4,6-dehydratase